MVVLVQDMLGGMERGSDAIEENQATLHIVIAENMDAQRVVARDVLKNEVFTGRNITVHDAVNAVEARGKVDSLVAEGHKVFCLLDLHMDETGENPELNGDSFIEGLVEDNVRIPVAVASGTIAHERARRLQQCLDGLTFLNKDAFSTEADPEERALLAQRIRRAADHSDVATVTAEQVAYLKRVVEEGMDVPEMHILVDVIKSEARKILHAHADELREIDGGVAMMEVHGLYDGNASLNVHEYKNALQLFIDRVKSQENPPIALLEDLTLLQSLVNNTYRSLVHNEDSIDIASVLDGLCKNLSKLSGREITLVSKVQSYSVPGDPAAVHHLLSNILQNALTHGSGEVEVEIQDNGTVSVWNETDTDLPFAILNGEVEGELPESSTISTGSATGIPEMMHVCDEHDFHFGIFPYDGGVKTFFSTGVTPQVERQYFTDAPLREPSAPFGFVGFMCHDDKPQKTFEMNETSCPDDFAIRYLDIPGGFPNFPRTDDEADRFVELCSEHYDDVLSNMSICFMHEDIIVCDLLTNALRKKYPHVLFMPTSHEPVGMESFASGRFADGKMKNPDIFEPSALAALAKPEDPATPDEVFSERYHTVYSASVFRTLIAIANRRALESSGDE